LNSGFGWFPYNLTLAATFSYDNEGRLTGESYPTDSSGTTANVSYTFDSMGRLDTMTDKVASVSMISGATYGPANELLSLSSSIPYYYGGFGGETRTYNSLKQLTGISSGTYAAPMSISYTYPSTGNNGKISSQEDMVSGEIVSYSYDALNRLATAENQSTFSTPWGQGFTYDGFGNLTQVRVIQGSAPSFSTSYDYKNHAGGEDYNGNPGYVPLPAYGTSSAATYDAENRLAVLGGVTCPDACYSYAPNNKRVWRGVWASYGRSRTTDTITFWSVSGQKLGDYALTEVSGGASGFTRRS
jgi:YD repeat-containing protein